MMNSDTVIHCDGSVRNGATGVGVVVFRGGERIATESIRIDTQYTNNKAEYMAAMAAVRAASQHAAVDYVTIKTDSSLVYGQMTQGWRINYSHLRELNRQLCELIESMPFRVVFEKVPRKQISDANKLAREATKRQNGIH